MEMNTPPITVTDIDLQRLARLITNQDSEAADVLDAELARADVVPQNEIAGDVVTMNSEVSYEDLATGLRRQVRIVYPQEADPDRGWVSVLAPLGSALLGLRVGQTIDWHMPNGVRRLLIVAVPYQPEANGDFTL
jgi:regulator of nucleoside diphosphate kinase